MRADNCSGLSDCSAGVQITLALLAVLLAVLAIWMIASVVAAGAAAAELEALAAAEVAAAEAEAAAAAEAAAVAEAAAAEAAAAEAAAAEAAAAEAAAAEAGEAAAGEAAAEGAGEAAAGEAAEGEAAAEAEAESAAARQQRLDELARDPAHGGKVTRGSVEEARAADGLERSGRLDGPVSRDPSGAADFVDGNGTPWDVKSFNSNFPPGKGGYDLATSMSKIEGELATGENVILNTTNLSAQAAAELRSAVEAAGWAGRVLFWP